MNKRALLRGRELPLILIFLLLLLLWLSLSGLKKGETALVEQRGTLLYSFPLGESRRVELEGAMTLVFDGEGVHAESAACPDQVCVQTGKITKSGEAIVCLPAGLSVRLTGGNGYDSFTY